eukprot:2751866-Pyramimonas_sp.AAC.1
MVPRNASGVCRSGKGAATACACCRWGLRCGLKLHVDLGVAVLQSKYAVRFRSRAVRGPAGSFCARQMHFPPHQEFVRERITFTLTGDAVAEAFDPEAPSLRSGGGTVKQKFDFSMEFFIAE